MGALPNATYIGFTGTPIDQIAYGKGTFKVFGGDDREGYLDKYSIARVDRDGATVPLHYALAPNDLRVTREKLEQEFLDSDRIGGRQRHRGAEPHPGTGGDAQEHAQEPGTRRAVARTSRSTSARTSSRWASRRSWSPSIGRRVPLQEGARPAPAARVVRRSSSAAGTTTRRACPLPPLRRGGEERVRKAFRKPDEQPEDPDRDREAPDRLRRPDPVRDVPRQADAGPRPAAGDRACEQAV